MRLSGSSEIFLGRASATRCRPEEGGFGHRAAIDRNHSDLVKFSHLDSDLESIARKVKDLAQNAEATFGRQVIVDECQFYPSLFCLI
jgi:hypothetical protein